MIWLLMAVVFGGLGGHKFSLISRLEFLETSNLSYYESHEAMLEAQKAYRKRKKELAELAYNEAYGKGTGVSYYSGAKTGRLIYEEEAKLMALNDELKALKAEEELENLDEEAEAEALAEGEAEVEDEDLEVEGDFLNRAQVLELLELRQEQIKARLAEEKERADSDEDIRRAGNRKSGERQSGTFSKKVASKSKAGNDSEEVTAKIEKVEKLADDLVIASEVDIRFLDNKCGTFNDRFERTPVVFRKGTTAIKGASLDELDTLILIARSCGDIRLSILPTFDGEEEDAEIGKDLLSRRNAEVKYYLLQRRVPKDMIAMHGNVN